MRFYSDEKIVMEGEALEFKPFSGDDFECWAGAEEDALLAEIEVDAYGTIGAGLIIVDSLGIQIECFFEFDNGQFASVLVKDYDYNFLAAKAFTDLLIRKKMRYEDLLKLGFIEAGMEWESYSGPISSPSYIKKSNTAWYCAASPENYESYEIKLLREFIFTKYRRIILCSTKKWLF